MSEVRSFEGFFPGDRVTDNRPKKYFTGKGVVIDPLRRRVEAGDVPVRWDDYHNYMDTNNRPDFHSMKPEQLALVPSDGAAAEEEAAIQSILEAGHG